MANSSVFSRVDVPRDPAEEHEADLQDGQDVSSEECESEEDVQEQEETSSDEGSGEEKGDDVEEPEGLLRRADHESVGDGEEERPKKRRCLAAGDDGKAVTASGDGECSTVPLREYSSLTGIEKYQFFIGYAKFRFPVGCGPEDEKYPPKYGKLEDL